MREDNLMENKGLIMKLEAELKEERRNNAELRVKLQLIQVDLLRQQKENFKNNQTNL